MSEENPTIRITSGEETFEPTRLNATQYRFFGKLAMYDHVFLLRDAQKGLGSYIFTGSPAYEQISSYMVEHKYPIHANLQEVAECDRRAFDQMIEMNVAKDFDGGVPEDWE